EKSIQENVLVRVYGYSRDFSPGQRICFPARLGPFKNFENPGRYNYVLAMSARDLVCTASVSDGRRIVPMGRGRLGFPLDVLEKARRSVRDLFNEHLSSENRALFKALILGEKQEITPQLREPFSRTGLGHILAVSGLHVGLMGWLAFTLIKGLLSLSYRITLGTDIRKIAAVITCFPIVGYACLAGFEVSTQRAMIMALAYLLSMILDRENEHWSTLALAAMIVLSLDPHALFTISFQLSFCAVIGILWFAPVIYGSIPFSFEKSGRAQAVLRSLSHYFVGLLAVTLTAMVFLLPVTAFYFHCVSLVSIPANLTAVPVLGFWVLPFGLAAALTQAVFPSLAIGFLKIAVWGMDGLMAMTHYWAHFSWASLWVFRPNPFEILLFYGLLFFLYFLRRGIWVGAGLICVLLFIAGDIGFWTMENRFNRTLKVTYLDVGQGNAALIQFPGKERMLIDGGGFSRDTFDTGRMVIAPFLLFRKIGRIDYLVMTHPQADHMNGLRFIAETFHPKEFWHNGIRGKSPSYWELMGMIESKKIKTLTPSDWSGEREISGVGIRLLHPAAEWIKHTPENSSMGLNNHSMVLKMTYTGKSFLFSGDLEKEGEDAVIAGAWSHLQSDVLLVPHHGSRTSCSKPFLERVKPRIGVISSGSGNAFGFPHDETLQRLEGAGCRTLRIDEKGAVRIIARPERFVVKSTID
ncbi:MAG: DNA internalization-related competence protein ComEC/Rec2, partial [Pseudomonadota bacterium]